MSDLTVKVYINNKEIVDTLDKSKIKILMLKGEKGDTVSAEWGTITGTVYDQTDLANILNAKANTNDLASVALSGRYNDLTDLPAIPTKTSDLTNDSDFVTEAEIRSKANQSDLDTANDNITINATAITNLTSRISDDENDIENNSGDIEILTNKVGDLSNLNTTDKTSLVNAINETNEIIVSATEPTTNRRKVWLQKGKNLFDGILRQGNHVNFSTGNRLCNSNPIKAKGGVHYTVSTNLPTSYSVKLMNCASNALDATIINDGSWEHTSANVYCGSDGYLKVLVKKDDDSNLTPRSIANYHFMVEQNSEATTYEAYVEPEMYSKNDNDIYEDINFMRSSVATLTAPNSNFTTYDCAVVSYGKIRILDIYIAYAQDVSTYQNLEIVTGLDPSISRMRGTLATNVSETSGTPEVYQLQIDAGSSTLLLRTLGKAYTSGKELRGQFIYVTDK